MLLESDKTPEELFSEAKEWVGFENCNVRELRRYIWRGTNPEGEEVNPDAIGDGEIMFYDKKA